VLAWNVLWVTLCLYVTSQCSIATTEHIKMATFDLLCYKGISAITKNRRVQRVVLAITKWQQQLQSAPKMCGRSNNKTDGKLTMRVRQTTCGWLAYCARHHDDEKVVRSTILVQRHAAPLTDWQTQTFIQNKVDHCLRNAVVWSGDAAVETLNAM